MGDVYELTRGSSPLLVSMPHSGTKIPAGILRRFSEQAKRLDDTDWFIPELYGFVFDADITVVKANYSRLVIDLNRPPDDHRLYPDTATTGLCPVTLFDGGHVYHTHEPVAEDEISDRKEKYWQPYHDALAMEISRIKTSHGFCILYDAHSIRSSVPRLFDGSLPDLNLGTDMGRSCDGALQRLLESFLEQNSLYSTVVNGRFIGGHITRHYGSPQEGCHALQMEIARRAYMEENTSPKFDEDRAGQLVLLLRDLFNSLGNWHPGPGY